MNYLDIRIDELMSKTDAHLLRSTQPFGWQGLYRSMRSGRLKKVVWMIDLVSLFFLLVAIWAGYHFAVATDLLSALKHGLPAVVLLLVAGQMKLSLMPHIQTERVLRQMKRIEILLLAKNHNVVLDQEDR